MPGTLAIDILDVKSRNIPESIDLFFHNSAPGPIPCARAVDGSKTISVGGLEQGTYKLEIDVPCYRDLSIFVNIWDGQTTKKQVSSPVDPRRVIAITAPIFADLPKDVQDVLTASKSLLGAMTAAEYYDTLDPIRKAGLLNLTTKATATRQSSGVQVFTSTNFKEFIELRGDRLFAVLDESVLTDTNDSCLHGVFHSVDESLHSIPGCDPVGSVKTNDKYGNLQLSLFRREEDGRLLVDMDIDDAQGIDHIFQVLGNAITGEPTHPYNIHEILIAYQGLDPGYELQVRPEAAPAPPTPPQAKKAKAGKR